MQLTSIFVVSTTLLAAQVPAQFVHAIEPNLPSWSTPASPAVASSMATPIPASSMAMASQPSHYMANRPFRPGVHAPMHGQASSTMRPVARPSFSHSMVPVATPSPSSNFNSLSQNQNQNQGFRQPFAQSPEEPYAVPDGGIAPIDPLQPGSDVAPVLIQKPSGVDEGNSFCMGQCYAKKEQAHCAKPYASPMYKSAHDCWMCCFTAGDF